MDEFLGWASCPDDRHPPEGEAYQDEAWLLGQPPLDSYLDHVAKTVASRTRATRSELVDEWRKANDYYYELEITEAGQADQIEILELP